MTSPSSKLICYQHRLQNGHHMNKARKYFFVQIYINLFWIITLIDRILYWQLFFCDQVLPCGIFFAYLRLDLHKLMKIQQMKACIQAMLVIRADAKNSNARSMRRNRLPIDDLSMRFVASHRLFRNHRRQTLAHAVPIDCGPICVGVSSWLFSLLRKLRGFVSFVTRCTQTVDRFAPLALSTI